MNHTKVTSPVSFDTLSSADARNDWSAMVDRVVREKPVIVKRTRDYIFVANIQLLEELLNDVIFYYEQSIEEDGTYVASSVDMDLVESGATEEEAKNNLASDILEYAKDYYEEFSVWSSAPNRKRHIPFVLKALLLNTPDKIGANMQCQTGKI